MFLYIMYTMVLYILQAAINYYFLSSSFNFFIFLFITENKWSHFLY